MLTVRFKMTRNSDAEIYTAERLAWNSITDHFILYDEDNKVIRTMKGFHLEVKAVVNVTDT